MVKYLKESIIVIGTVGIVYSTYQYIQSNYYYTDYPKSQRELTRLLQFKKKMITKDIISNTMISVDRIYFLPKDAKDIYYDLPQPIGFNATLSAPHMAGVMLDYLADHLVSGAKALDIGSGSGYISACMSRLVGAKGQVVGVDHIQELVDQSIENIKRCDPTILNNTRLICGDGFAGWSQEAPYDCIYVGAASEEVPEQLVKQLRPGGRMVIPVGPSESFHQLLLVDKLEDGTINIKSCGVVRFVPLTTKQNQLHPTNSANSTKIVQNGNQKLLVRTTMVPAPDSKEFKEYEAKLNQKLKNQ